MLLSLLLQMFSFRLMNLLLFLPLEYVLLPEHRMYGGIDKCYSRLCEHSNVRLEMHFNLARSSHLSIISINSVEREKNCQDTLKAVNVCLKGKESKISRGGIKRIRRNVFDFLKDDSSLRFITRLYKSFVLSLLCNTPTFS